MQNTSRYPDTYYSRTSSLDRHYPLVDGKLSADVCIIGGGLAGLTAALTLARAGRSVILLEANRIAWGASGRNGGFVSSGYATSLSAIARAVGQDQAKELYRLSMEGLEFVRSNIEKLHIENAHPVRGIYKALRYPSGGNLLRSRDEHERSFGPNLKHISGENIRQVFHSSKYHEALLDETAFHFHPLNYALALAQEAGRLGAAIHEKSPVVSVEANDPRKRIMTSHARIEAQHVVFATGGYTGNILPALKRSYLPISTYVALTEAAPELVQDAIRTRAAVLDDRRAGDYYRLVDNGSRILWGGRITTRTADSRSIADMLRREMIGTYPQLSGLKMDLAWSGLMSYARHLMPQIGQSGPGVWHATAFGGHGMNTTALGGVLIAKGILGQSDRYRLFEPFGLNWNGGPFGRAGVQLTYWAYQVADYWRERNAAISGD